MKLSAPWVKFYREIEALFAQDDDVRVTYDEGANEVKLFVDNPVKADALNQLLPTEKEFGNVKIKITVVPANEGNITGLDLIERAFEGNPALCYTVPIDCPMGHYDYAVFQAKVVQFFNDDLSDINGNCSTLYQDIAKDVFGEKAGVFFCTAAPDKLTKPLGEWP